MLRLFVRRDSIKQSINHDIHTHTTNNSFMLPPPAASTNPYWFARPDATSAESVDPSWCVVSQSVKSCVVAIQHHIYISKLIPPLFSITHNKQNKQHKQVPLRPRAPHRSVRPALEA
jgi:hypothetical protein